MRATRKYSEGSVHGSVSYGEFKVINYFSSREVEIEFIDTGYKTRVRVDAIKSGKIKDKLRPTILGVGFVGIGDHKTSSNSVVDPAYNRWYGMLSRCYDRGHKFFNYYGGKGVTVCKEWHNFQNFARWYTRECKKLGLDPKDNGHEIDKDISGKKVYSPKTCKFITTQMNSEVSKSKHYKFISPDNERVSLFNLRKFCREQGLAQGHMGDVHSGKAKSHKGWTKG
ncbi:HNH endonuclease [Vibrio phage K437a]